jgi:integrase
MFKIHFYLRNFEKAKAGDELTIYCQLEIEGQQRDNAFSTKIKVPKRYWKNTAVSRAYVWSEEINKKLERITNSFIEIYQAISKGSPINSYYKIRELYDPTTSKPKSIKPKTYFEVYEEMLKKKKVEPGTLRNYGVRCANLKKFFVYIRNPNPLITDIKYAELEKMLDYFREFSNGHRKKHACDINQVLDFAVKRDYLQFNPLGKIVLPGDPELPPKYLTADLRQKIKDANIDSLKKVRDISVFLWATGLSYTDYCSLTHSDLIMHQESVWIKKQRKKSGIYSLVPILEEAAEIIERYGEVEKLPKKNLADFNKDLKFLGDFLGINSKTVGFNLSSSVFRETFCSIMENEYMIEDRTIMFMMGHKTKKQRNIYSHIMPARMKYELEKTGIRLFDLRKKAS